MQRPTSSGEKHLQQLVENEVPLILIPVGISIGSSRWREFCERVNSSEFRWQTLCSHRSKNVKEFANSTSYAMVIC